MGIPIVKANSLGAMILDLNSQNVKCSFGSEKKIIELWNKNQKKYGWDFPGCIFQDEKEYDKLNREWEKMRVINNVY